MGSSADGLRDATYDKQREIESNSTKQSRVIDEALKDEAKVAEAQKAVDRTKVVFLLDCLFFYL